MFKIPNRQNRPIFWGWRKWASWIGPVGFVTTRKLLELGFMTIYVYLRMGLINEPFFINKMWNLYEFTAQSC